jgi:hypothetical protein
MTEPSLRVVDLPKPDLAAELRAIADEFQGRTDVTVMCVIVSRTGVRVAPCGQFAAYESQHSYLQLGAHKVMQLWCNEDSVAGRV